MRWWLSLKKSPRSCLKDSSFWMDLTSCVTTWHTDEGFYQGLSSSKITSKKWEKQWSHLKSSQIHIKVSSLKQEVMKIWKGANEEYRRRLCHPNGRRNTLLKIQNPVVEIWGEPCFLTLLCKISPRKHGKWPLTYSCFSELFRGEHAPGPTYIMPLQNLRSGLRQCQDAGKINNRYIDLIYRFILMTYQLRDRSKCSAVSTYKRSNCSIIPWIYISSSSSVLNCSYDKKIHFLYFLL